MALGMSGSWAVASLAPTSGVQAEALASAFFGVHPVHTENVLYLVCRAVGPLNRL